MAGNQAPVSHRLGRAVAAIGLAVFVIAALLSGTDRQSRDLPNSPAFVGWPYDTGAARTQAITSFVKSGPMSAIGYARRAILSDPLSAQAVSILGRAQLYAGQSAEARETFEVSGQMGWRDEMTQLYWLDQAMQAGDLTVSAERLDAILRQTPMDGNRDRFLALVSATPEGRAALAIRLKAKPAWADPYAVDLKEIPPEQLIQRVDVMRRAGSGVWDCPAAAQTTQKLIEANLLSEAQSVWRLDCATSASLVYDGGFDKLDTTKSTTGFEWQLSARGDITIAVSRDAKGNEALDLGGAAGITVPAVQQLLVLAPGRYRLVWRTPDTTAAAANGLRASLSCKPDLREAVSGQPLPGQSDGHVQEFVVDAQCADRWLTFWLAPGGQVRLDDVTLALVKP